MNKNTLKKVLKKTKENPDLVILAALSFASAIAMFTFVRKFTLVAVERTDIERMKDIFAVVDQETREQLMSSEAFDLFKLSAKEFLLVDKSVNC